MPLELPPPADEPPPPVDAGTDVAPPEVPPPPPLLPLLLHAASASAADTARAPVRVFFIRDLLSGRVGRIRDEPGTCSCKVVAKGRVQKHRCPPLFAGAPQNVISATPCVQSRLHNGSQVNKYGALSGSVRLPARCVPTRR